MSEAENQRAKGRAPGRVMRAVCRTVLEKHARADGLDFAIGPDRAAAEAKAATFVHSRIAAAPDFIAFGLRGLGAAFAALTILRTGRPLDRLSAKARRTRLDAWRTSRLGLFRDYIRLCESLTIYWLYSNAPGADHRNAPASAASAPPAAKERRANAAKSS